MGSWEDTTNWLGSFGFRLPGNPDVSRCTARLSRTCRHGLRCLHWPGPWTEALLQHVWHADVHCGCTHIPASPAHGAFASALPPPPAIVLLPLPPLPRLHSPMKASACPYDNWMKPEYRCYWRVVSPDMKVAVVFGLLAAGRYGTNMTLREGLEGSGDVYRTLLREATAALLNSYNNVQFRYPTLSVICLMNSALLGSPQHALITALRFKRANSGAGNLAGRIGGRLMSSWRR